MPDILTHRSITTLAHFASSNVLVAFDYDGTLAAIASQPTRARMRVRTERLLRAVAERYPCVVISGRTRPDIERRLERIPLWHVAGNYGVEPWGEDERDVYASRVREWMPPLQRRLAAHEGVVIEDKTYSIAVHYRHARRKRLAIRAIVDAARRLTGSRVLGGNQAVNVLQRGAPHKGIALERVRNLFACDMAIYVGDDDTDEDAFRAATPDRLLAIRVGAKRHSRARHWLKSQTEVDSFLQALLSLRTSPNRRQATG